ncbi:hypothetical protein [Flagellimonas allohymeniacidonis]|uniref:Uncharacterized protein n=1 Tax=Flagellimonas allohymeniacidonis TaxID=2517819 RepID=A0A4Q8QFK2_9FLAO|nr:hypothetical protein [Allomuricauda hymeniacidonis]TAI49275.1 hypothetical protein EW142_05625 [Allomuricauda hymeniacidonis]
MKKAKYTLLPRFISLILLLVICYQDISAQGSQSRTLAETFFGHEALFFQLVVKKAFSPTGKLNFFTVATYTADYENDVSKNNIVIPVQLSYDLGKGFGIMGGTDIGSISGFSAIVGPQFNYSSKKFLAITVASFFLNSDNDFKLFGLYEYKPTFNENWGLYTRIQFVLNQSWRLGINNQQYLYLRLGLKNNQFVYGLATNLERSGPLKERNENYGLFVRWEFD